MVISVFRIDTRYRVVLLSMQNVVQGEVRFNHEADAFEFAELWGDWVGATKVLVTGAQMNFSLDAA
ncbi:hypothetical protein LCM08_24985 [Salipiger pacificus]|nr:hypothetical protein [Alloyangia pacifica]MCA0948197.1 hypothetical protein [Alloyangia pacifica]